MGEPLPDGLFAPGVIGGGGPSSRPGFVGNREEPLGRILPARQDYVFNPLAERLLDLVIDRQPAGIHDPHVEPGGDGVVQEDGVHRLPHAFVAAKGERQIGDAPGDEGSRAGRPDAWNRLDELDGVAIVFGHPRRHREDVRVEDDVFRRDAGLVLQQPIGSAADGGLALRIHRLTLLVEGHHDDGGSEAADPPRGSQKRLLPVLE